MSSPRFKPGIFFFLTVYAAAGVGVGLLPLPVFVKIPAALLLAVVGYGLWHLAGPAKNEGAVDQGPEAEEESGEPQVVPIETPAAEAVLPQVLPEPVVMKGVDPGDLQALVPVLDTALADFKSLQSVCASLAEFKAGSDFIRDNVERSFEISDNLANSAKQAFELSEQVQKGVMVVTNALAESLKQTMVLFEYSKKIAMIIEIMSEISEKIHILSINASIVSARAGALGRGFEVVAKEIRLLAKETENSLGDIEGVIGELKSTVETVTKVVREADVETEREKNALMAVAGSLQGVVLGVEIVRAVSTMAREKSDEQSRQMAATLGRIPSGDSLTHLEELKNRLQELSAKE